MIYYYRCSGGLKGGELQFVDKYASKFSPYFEGLEFVQSQKIKNNFNNVQIPVKTGTLVVFSNYQMIHRVMRIIHDQEIKNDPESPDGKCSRDFILFFIQDPVYKLKTTESQFSYYADPDNYDTLKEIRDSVFFDQLKSSGKFGNYPVWVGNGDVNLLKWIDREKGYCDKNYYSNEEDEFDFGEEEEEEDF